MSTTPLCMCFNLFIYLQTCVTYRSVVSCRCRLQDSSALVDSTRSPAEPELDVRNRANEIEIFLKFKIQPTTQ